MNRREFIAGAVSTSSLAVVPNIFPTALANETTILREKILSTFPKVEVEEGIKNMMSFFITILESDSINHLLVINQLYHTFQSMSRIKCCL